MTVYAHISPPRHRTPTGRVKTRLSHLYCTASQVRMTRWALAVDAGVHALMRFSQRTSGCSFSNTYLGQCTEKPPRASLIRFVCLFCFWFVSNEVTTIWDTSTVISHVSTCKVVVVVMVVVIVGVVGNQSTTRHCSDPAPPLCDSHGCDMRQFCRKGMEIARLGLGPPAMLQELSSMDRITQLQDEIQKASPPHPSPLPRFADPFVMTPRS